MVRKAQAGAEDTEAEVISINLQTKEGWIIGFCCRYENKIHYTLKRSETPNKRNSLSSHPPFL